MQAAPPLISVSIISHGHIDFIYQIIPKLIAIHQETPLEIIITFNLRAEFYDFSNEINRSPIKCIVNDKPKGFSENHNRALSAAQGACFCVLNPDIILMGNPFPVLLSTLMTPGTGLVAPRIVNSAGELEDSARKFPLPWKLFFRLLKPKGHCEYGDSDGLLHPDWVAGIFMLISRADFKEIGGFDSRYHLYYEDVDLCARLRITGRSITWSGKVSVIHDARRSSRQQWTYLRWHLESALRFFLSPVFFGILKLKIGEAFSRLCKRIFRGRYSP